MSEKNNKKAYFIKKTIKLLNLQNAEIYDKAVEENTTNLGPFDVITARALAKTQKIISLSEHLLKQSGKFLLMKGTKEKVLNEVVQISSEDLKLLDDSSRKILKDFLNQYEKMSIIKKEHLEKIINELINRHKTNFKGVGQPLRIALTGSRFGPGIYDIILSLDKNETIKRLKLVE